MGCVHGGVRGRSVITNAQRHVCKAIVFSVDVKDFFPSVSPQIVRSIFEALGFRSGGFMSAYAGNRAEAVQETLESDPVSAAIAALIDNEKRE